MVTKDDAPPLLINAAGVLVPGGYIRRNDRVYMNGKTRVYHKPPGVTRIVQRSNC